MAGGQRPHTSKRSGGGDASGDQIEIRPEDLKVDTYRSAAPERAHVNMTDSAVRITHLPTGIVATCQDERSQMGSRARPWPTSRPGCPGAGEAERRRTGHERRSDPGSGPLERIRTYNFLRTITGGYRINLTSTSWTTTSTGTSSGDRRHDPAWSSRSRTPGGVMSAEAQPCVHT